MLLHHKYVGKILNQAAGILTDFEAFFSEFSSQFGLEWETVKIKEINKQDVWHGNRQAHKFTKNYQVFMPLHKIVSLLVSTYFTTVLFTDYTQEEPLFKLESPTRYYMNFCLWNSWNLSCTDS